MPSENNCFRTKKFCETSNSAGKKKEEKIIQTIHICKSETMTALNAESVRQAKELKASSLKYFVANENLPSEFISYALFIWASL